MAKPPNPELASRIVQLALAELADKPPEAVNMRSLAAKAGVSPTAIYYYFASKEALFERIKFETLGELEAAIGRVLEGAAGASGRDKLAALCRAFVAFSLSRPHLAGLLMEELPPRLDLDEEAMERYYRIHDQARSLVVEALADGSMEGPRDPDLEASVGQAALWGLVAQFKAKRVHPRFWNDIDPLVERFLELFLGGKGVTE